MSKYAPAEKARFTASGGFTDGGQGSATRCPAAGLSPRAATAGVASAEEAERGIDPNQGRSLVEVSLPSKGAAMRLQLQADSLDVEFNEHYLRRNGDGSVTVTVSGTAEGDNELEDAGYDLLGSVDRRAEHLARADGGPRGRDPQGRARAAAAESDTAGTRSDEDEGLRYTARRHYFEHYAGRLPVGRGQDTSGQRGAGRLELHRPDAVGVVEPGAAPHRSTPRRARCR